MQGEARKSCSDRLDLVGKQPHAPAEVLEFVENNHVFDATTAALGEGGALEAFIGQQLYAGPRFGFLLMTVFGSIGLVLVTVGVYSVLAYSTTEKTHEIGIRMALGAKHRCAADGRQQKRSAAGRRGPRRGSDDEHAGGGVLGTRLVGVTAYDPRTLATVAVSLTTIAAIACWIPARRAARVDPLVAPRYE
jgi:putative ABC transport system permease protein